MIDLLLFWAWNTYWGVIGLGVVGSVAYLARRFQ